MKARPAPCLSVLMFPGDLFFRSMLCIWNIWNKDRLGQVSVSKWITLLQNLEYILLPCADSPAFLSVLGSLHFFFCSL